MLTVNTNTLVGEYKWISSSDPALDKDAEEFGEKMRLFRDGQGKAPLKPGAVPTVFTLRHLSGRYFKKVSPFLGRAADEPEHALEASWAIAATVVVDVDNLKDQNGKNVVLEHERDRDGTTHLTDTSLEILGLGLVREICEEALQRRSGGPL